ncbi:hypothetical protein [Effusibacillus lacus]|uniref:Uncharacterized protein n=1 Tax=Effusibacillus lacus TaxID=1348429 RepID=A0A292YMS1_9BACL|nr:hypothetical protein [Effusibacillus lacus]TCS76897.1 hypothetical protein EDD64_101121 [Effusibacillus lacus]GAX91228.1 hypothetical protein EFBL_2894 [Effusibacillus lacus]
MKMAWWVFIFYLIVTTVLVQYMVESFMAQHYSVLPYYGAALAFMLVTAWLTYMFFMNMEQSRE